MELGGTAGSAFRTLRSGTEPGTSVAAPSAARPGSAESGNFMSISQAPTRTASKQSQPQRGIMAQSRWQLGRPASLALWERALLVPARYFHPRGCVPVPGPVRARPPPGPGPARAAAAPRPARKRRRDPADAGGGPGSGGRGAGRGAAALGGRAAPGAPGAAQV